MALLYANWGYYLVFKQAAKSVTFINLTNPGYS
jgi:hypothetical protein